MRIVVVGTGYVGLVSGACFSEFGHKVTCVDTDQKKIDNLHKGIMPIYEPGLDDLVERNVKAERLTFTTNLNEALTKDVDAIFIAVGTPPHPETGHADLKYVYAVATEIAENLKGYAVIIDKSTVPVGTAREVYNIIAQKHKKGAFDVASNPEFLREGSAIEDFMRPDRVVVGVETNKAKDVMEKIYRPLNLRETPLIFTTIESAEITKYAGNAFLALKIGFINEIADLCEQVNANVQDVAKGIGADNRIGSKFLHPGPGYGGSCFPKDTLALAKTAQDKKCPVSIVESVIASNTARKRAMADKIIEACGGSVAGKTIGILGLAFKANTDDMRDAPSLDIIPALQKAGAKIKAFDPEAAEEAKHLLENIEYCEDSYATAQDADALVILTEWNMFRALDLGKVKSLLKEPLLIDLRNIYTLREVEEHNFNYVSIGRPIGRLSL
ncbi:MAG: UDP-glucose dehydrogenase family protein [Alphaproteobacteria bacterium]